MQDLDSGVLDLVGQLQPKTFEYTVDAQTVLNAPPGNCFGMMAQDVQAILPDLVSTVVYPAVHDSLGNEIHPEVEVLGLEYTELVPILVAALKELHGQSIAQEARLDQLQADLAACCAYNDEDNQLNFLPAGAPGGTSTTRERSLLVHPDPFSDRAAIAYAIDAPAAITMLVIGANGQHVTTLDLGQAGAGIFTYVWNTEGLAPGQYILSMLVDGEVDAVRVMKLDR